MTKGKEKVGVLEGSVVSMYLSGFLKDYDGKGCVLMKKETRTRFGRIEVGGEENSKWIGRLGG